MTTHYCIACGEPFESNLEDAVLCPACGGTPEAPDDRTMEAERPADLTASPPAPLKMGERRQVGADWQVGETILDTYEVRHIFTSGGMGLVYRVHHRGWNIDLALKSPRAEIFSSTSGKESFVREAETWVDLGLHPHIVSCYYVRNLDEIPRVFAEFVEGGSLKDWIEDKRLYEGGNDKALERILDIAIQFAWGLGYAHEKGLVHQDVKPANILMTPEGVAKVSDFGLAKARAEAGERVGMAGGGSLLVSSGGMTPAYCSPEQARGEKLSLKTDIWSWGVSILEMFTGEVYWRSGGAAGEVLEAYLEDGGPEAGLPSMPEGVGGLLGQCFRREPAERPKDMLAVAGRLQEIYREKTGQTYTRQIPKAIELRADSLNNKALSMLDLGKDEWAEKAWQAALEIDSQHPEATYNLGMWRWIQGRLTDLELVQQLEAVTRTQVNAWMPHYLLGLVHTHRGDISEARQALEEARRLSPGSSQVQSALGRLDELQPVGCLHTYEFPEEQKVYELYALAITPDRQQVVVGSRYVLPIVELDSGECLGNLYGHQAYVKAVAITPNGAQVVSGSDDNTLRVYDLASRTCLHILQGHTYGVKAVAITPDGRQVVSGSDDHTLRVWDLASGECQTVLQSGSVHSIAITPDGQFAVKGGGENLQVWDLDSGTCLHELYRHAESGFIDSIAITPDGCHIIAGCWNGTIWLWDLASGECLRSFQGHKEIVSALAVTPDGRLLVSGSWDNTLRVWNLEDGVCLHTLRGHADHVNTLAISPDGSWVASGGEDKTLRVWQLPGSNHLDPEWVINRPLEVQAVQAVSADVRAKLENARSALQSGQVRQAARALRQALLIPGFERDPAMLTLWYEAGKRAGRRQGVRLARILYTQQGFNNYEEALSISPDGRLAVVGGEETLHVLDIASGRILRSLKDDESDRYHVTALVITPDGQQAISGDIREDIRIWNLSTGRCRLTLHGHEDDVTTIAITPDGRRAVSGSRDKTLRVWNLDNGTCLHILKGHTNRVETLAITPDGRLAVSGSRGYDDGLRVWDLASGACLHTLKGHSDEVITLAITPDGRKAVSGSRDKTLRVWDPARGKCLSTLKGHTGQVPIMAIMPDGRQVVSGGWEGSFRTWDLARGKCLRNLEGRGIHRTDYGNKLAITPDGRFAIAGILDKTLYVWDLNTGAIQCTLEGHKNPVKAFTFTPDGRQVLSLGEDKTLIVWAIDWDYEFPDPVDWDEGALPYLEIFLDQNTPLRPDRSSRQSKPLWSDTDFQELLTELGYRGFGWLRAEGVRRKLEEMAKKRG
jgi:WD40 repeat protein/serine/threonine protein kinase